MGRKKNCDNIKIPKIEQLPSGSYRARVVIDGQRKSITKATYDECVAEYLALKHGVMEAKKAPPKKKKTLKKAVEDHIAELEGHRSPSTIAGYRKDARNTFQRAMSWDVYTTTDEQWQEAIRDERKLGRSSHYIKNAWSLMAAAIKKETKHRPEVMLYPPESTERAWLDHEEIDILVAAVKGHKVEIPVLLCISSLRRSELLGLKWSQVDFKRNTITIDGAVVRGTDGLVSKRQNKTRKSKRTIPIIPPLREALEKADRKSDKVVTMSADTVLKYVHRLCQENNITDVDLHGLRHSFASLAYHLRIPEMIAAEIGGWDDLGTMHKIYTHLAKADIANRAQDFCDYFDPVKRKAKEAAKMATEMAMKNESA